MKKAGVIGSGIVAQTLGAGLAQKGWSVTLGTRDPDKLAEWKKKVPSGVVASPQEAAKFGELVILAVKGTGAEATVRQIGPSALAGKTVIDACNPIADDAPQEGVLRFFTGPNESLMERLLPIAPQARFVKAFNSVGSALMVDPKLAGGPPTMFICGADAEAKKEVAELLQSFGWEHADMGGPQAARAIEPLCMLWCIPGFRDNDWTHAFKLLKA